MQEKVPLVAADSFAWPLGPGERLDTSVELFHTLAAPVTAGTKAGQAVFSLDGKEVGRVDLLCGETVLPSVTSALSVLKEMWK